MSKLTEIPKQPAKDNINDALSLFSHARRLAFYLFHLHSQQQPLALKISETAATFKQLFVYSSVSVFGSSFANLDEEITKVYNDLVLLYDKAQEAAALASKLSPKELEVYRITFGEWLDEPTIWAKLNVIDSCDDGDKRRAIGSSWSRFLEKKSIHALKIFAIFVACLVSSTQEDNLLKSALKKLSVFESNEKHNSDQKQSITHEGPENERPENERPESEENKREDIEKAREKVSQKTSEKERDKIATFDRIVNLFQSFTALEKDEEVQIPGIQPLYPLDRISFIPSVSDVNEALTLIGNMIQN